MQIATFREFWLVYLRGHADPRCRALHYCAAICGLVGLFAAAATKSWQPALTGTIAAYAFAWAGHLFVEKNAPLTFRYPLWSLAADYLMFFRWASGRLSADLARAGV